MTQEIKNFHHFPFSFGTDGIRGSIGTPPFTQEYLMLFGTTLGHWAQKKYAHPSFAFARDTRASGSFIQSALQTGLLLHEVQLYDAGILPTPALYKIASLEKKSACTLMISASHNPWHDNGIKITDIAQGKLSLEDEAALTAAANIVHTTFSYTTFGTLEQWPTAADQYIQYICSLFPPHFLRNLSIVLDCAHGATGTVAPAIFNLLGAHTIVINNSPTGKNINDHCGPLHPASLQETVQKTGAILGFSFDGDGDRILAVNHEGICKDGDDILYLLMHDPQYIHDTHVVGTVMTNQALINILQTRHTECVRVPVGDKHVAQYLASSKQARLGGEPSGHVMFKEYALMSDSIYTALRLIQTVLATDNMAMHSFEKYPHIMHTIPVQHRPRLDADPYCSIIAEYTSKVPHGRVLVRYSGTEPVLRVMVEDADAQHAQKICTLLVKILTSTLQGTV